MKTETPPDYASAFAYIVGSLTARERLGLPPLKTKILLQRVYDEYGVLPIDSIVQELGLEVAP